MAGNEADASGKDKSIRFTTSTCYLSSTVFVVILIVSIIVGAVGPSAYSTKETTNHNHLECRTPSCNVKWRGRLTHMSPLHQALTLNAVVDNPLMVD